ncbi:hypothetical protein [Paraburkholderia sp. MM5482-R1]|uniref:hypothetical protein n=1 Tax=unclassified Paraburkholderia TaxID=2615204 RepID=UPI003D1C1ACA
MQEVNTVKNAIPVTVTGAADIEKLCETQRPAFLQTVNPPAKKEAKEVAQFRETVIAGQQKGTGYRDALNEALACAYKSFYLYRKAPWSETRKEMFDVLKELAKNEFEVHDKTKPEHIIVQLTFGELPMATKSQRARLMRLAISESEGIIKPDEFIVWLGGKGGIVNALKNPNAKTTEQKQADCEAKMNSARIKASAFNLGKVENVKVTGLPPMMSDREIALAIIERDAEGNFIVMGFTDNQHAIDVACVAHAKAVDSVSKSLGGKNA